MPMASLKKTAETLSLIDYTQRMRKCASSTQISSVNLYDLLRQYASLKPIAEVGEYFSTLPDSRRLLLLVFLFGAENLSSHLAANLAWRARDNIHVFSTLDAMHRWTATIYEYTKGMKAQIFFSANDVEQCNADLLQLISFASPNKKDCSLIDLAKSVALSIPPIYLYTALRRCLHYALQSAVNSFVVSHAKAQMAEKSFSRLWDSITTHLLRTPPRKRKRCHSMSLFKTSSM